jgi:hypothetical protein
MSNWNEQKKRKIHKVRSARLKPGGTLATPQSRTILVFECAAALCTMENAVLKICNLTWHVQKIEKWNMIRKKMKCLQYFLRRWSVLLPRHSSLINKPFINTIKLWHVQELKNETKCRWLPPRGWTFGVDFENSNPDPNQSSTMLNWALREGIPINIGCLELEKMSMKESDRVSKISSVALKKTVVWNPL